MQARSKRFSAGVFLTFYEECFLLQYPRQLPKIFLPTPLADNLLLTFPRPQGAFTDVELPGKGSSAQAQLLPQGDDLTGLALVKEEVVLVQQLLHWNLIERRQLVHGGGRVVGAGAGLHVDIAGEGKTCLGSRLLLQQALAVTEPPQPFRYSDCLCIAAAKVRELLGFRCPACWKQAERVKTKRCK